MPTCTNVSELEMLGSECIGIEVFFGFFWMRLYRALRGCSCGSLRRAATRAAEPSYKEIGI